MSLINTASPSDQDQLEQVKLLLKTSGNPNSSVQGVMEFLHKSRPDYHWVGIYVLKGDMLHLGPYVGPKTDHDIIPVGRGVCGTAVAEDKNQIIGDVRELTNYLACNLETRSEIVVLIRDPKSSQILGQIDVDGTKANSFGKPEERFLEEVAKLLSPCVQELIS